MIRRRALGRTPARIARALLLAASCAAIGCAPPLEDPHAPSAALRGAQQSAWLVRRVGFPPAARGVAPGYDLDAVDTVEPIRADCRFRMEDFTSARHPGLFGIDNAGQALIGTAQSTFGISFAEELDRAVAERRLRWAIRIGALSEEDGSLPVDLVLIDAGSEIALDSAGLPAAGQMLTGSLVATAQARPYESSAAGETHADGVPVDGDVTLLPFHAFRLGAIVLDASVAPSGTLFAELAGSFSVEDMMIETMRVAMDPDGDFSFARRIYEEVADLLPSADDPAVCTRISIGFTLEAVPLELVVR